MEMNDLKHIIIEVPLGTTISVKVRIKNLFILNLIDAVLVQ